MKNQKIKEFLSRLNEKMKQMKKAGPIFPAVMATALAVVVVGSYDSSIPELMLVEAAETEKGETQEQTPEKRVVSDLTPIDEMENEQVEEVEIASVEEAGIYHDGVYYGTGTGFRDGIVIAEVTIAGGAISNIEVVSAQYDGTSWLESCQALIASIIAAQSTNVDAISGATYSSRGIIGAVRDALNQAAAGTAADAAPDTTAAVSPETPEPEVEIGGEEEAADGYRDGTYTGIGKGFQDGELKVKLTIKKGKISRLKIISAQYDGEEFLAMIQPLIETIIKEQSTNVDAVSGATYSSRGLVQAVRDALKKAAIHEDEADDEENAESDTDHDKDIEEEITEETEEVDISNGLKDGTYYGTGKGFRDGELKIKVIISEGKILSITIESAQYDGKEWLSSLSGMIQNMIKTQSANVDSVSGATYSSRGLKQALVDVLKQAAVDPSAITEPEDTENPDDSGAQEEPVIPDNAVVLSGNAVCWPDQWEDFTEYGITVDVIFENDKIINIIARITTEENSETATNREYLNNALNGYGEIQGLTEQIKILNKELKTNEGDCIVVDAVSGATCSSYAVVDAINEALADWNVFYTIAE